MSAQIIAAATVLAASVLGASVLIAPAVVALPRPAASPVRVDGGWAAASLNGQRTGSVYLTVVNAGRKPDRLLDGTTSVAARVVPHHMASERGVMVMRKLDGVALPPGGRATFAPGGDHLMLEGLKRPLKAGETVTVTLRFQHAAPLFVRLPVRSARPMSGMAGMGR